MATIPLADAHTHLDLFAPEEVSSILQRAREAGVALVIAAGVTLESSERCVRLAGEHPQVLAGVGVHPTELRGPLGEADLERLRSLARWNPRVVCVSEVGLDFSPRAPEPSLQRDAFRLQIRLARELGLPIVFHSREAPGQPELHRETLRLLREEGAWEVGGAFHYFQGDERLGREALEMGFYISLAKPLLRLPHLQEVARSLPLEGLVLETDSYPQPFKRRRSRWTEPRDLPRVAQALADLKGLPLEEVARATTGNLLRMLKGRASLPALDGATPQPLQEVQDAENG